MPFTIHHREPFLPALDHDSGVCESIVQYKGKKGHEISVVVEVEYVRSQVIGSRIVKVYKDGKHLMFWSFSDKERNKIRLYGVNAAQTMLSSRHLAMTMETERIK